jgi:hypothetical protein
MYRLTLCFMYFLMACHPAASPLAISKVGARGMADTVKIVDALVSDWVGDTPNTRVAIVSRFWAHERQSMLGPEEFNESSRNRQLIELGVRARLAILDPATTNLDSATTKARLEAFRRFRLRYAIGPIQLLGDSARVKVSKVEYYRTAGQTCDELSVGIAEMWYRLRRASSWTIIENHIERMMDGAPPCPDR